MRTHFVFDVDGTITPNHQPMDAGFARFFLGFVRSNPVWLVSGGDYAKLARRVPSSILNSCAGVFASTGSELRIGGEEIYSKRHDFHPLVRAAAEAFVDTSLYPLKFGNHVEERPGTLNVSSVGRNAPLDHRKRYQDWDRETGERKRLIDAIHASGLRYEAFAGGEVSVDIVPAGWNKAIVRDEVLRRAPGSSIVFFADRMGPGGNDEPLARALRAEKGRHLCVPVTGWRDTERQLYDWPAALAA